MTRTARAHTVGLLLVGLTAAPGLTFAADARVQTVKLDGYAEWRQGDALIVDGQRVRFATNARFKGKDEVQSFAAIPLGWEVKVEGPRLIDGTVLVIPGAVPPPTIAPVLVDDSPDPDRPPVARPRPLRGDECGSPA